MAKKQNAPGKSPAHNYSEPANTYRVRNLLNAMYPHVLNASLSQQKKFELFEMGDALKPKLFIDNPLGQAVAGIKENIDLQGSILDDLNSANVANFGVICNGCNRAFI